MNPDPRETQALLGASGSAFYIGQPVRIRQEIYDPPTGETPGGTYAVRGDKVFIRRIGCGTFPVSVSHEDRVGSFTVSFDEIEPWAESPNAPRSATPEDKQ